MNTRFLFIFILFGCNISIAQNTEKQLRNQINSVYLENVKACASIMQQAIAKTKEKTELWNVCSLENGNRIIQIESHSNEVYFKEIYFEENGELVFAEETENFMPMNSFAQKVWSCKFYIQNSELATIISLGHGKTEDDTWDADIILQMYQNRLLELKKILK